MIRCLDDVLSALQALAPLKYAATWDNVGLLLEPESRDAPIQNAFLCIDLTPAVAREAFAAKAEIIIAYHPPIFSGVKRLLQADPRQAMLMELIGRRITIYSPHTALDAVPGGVCDWLLDQLPPSKARSPIEASLHEPSAGMGRQATLCDPISLDNLVHQLKARLGLKGVQVARAENHRSGLIKNVAICPGAGGSLFENLRGTDLLVTGEMRHHDVLGFREKGTSVVLTNHTHCERGYLPIYATRLKARLPELNTIVSLVDDDPLEFA